MATFREKWLAAVDHKGSVLCAGIDPAEHAMGRGDEGLPDGRDKRTWALSYVSAVAPYVAAVKPNSQYWKAVGDEATLREINELAHSLDLVVIDDSKLADIGSTNDAGIFYAAQRADAVTFSPFAGNMEEAVGQAKKRSLGLISMCLMSNPEFKREKNKLVEVGALERDYNGLDFVTFKADNRIFVPQYIQLAHDARTYGVDGVVIGAPSKKNHITDHEIDKIKYYVGDEMLVLLPGAGAQGGEVQAIWRYFDSNNVIVNVGRGLMFPNGSKSTPDEQASAANQYMEMTNELRDAA